MKIGAFVLGIITTVIGGMIVIGLSMGLIFGMEGEESFFLTILIPIVWYVVRIFMITKLGKSIANKKVLSMEFKICYFLFVSFVGGILLFSE